MKAWHAASLGFVMALVVGCGSSGPSPGMTLRGTYQAIGDGPYEQMTFVDGEHFFLTKSACSSDCSESGTYAVNAAGNVLALRDAATGKITELSFSALQSVPASATTLLANRVRPLGTPLTTGSPGSLTSPGGSLSSPGGSLSSSGGALASGQQPLVSDGGALTFDGGSLLGDGGSAMQGFNAGMQPFSLGDSGSGSSDAGSSTSEPFSCNDSGCTVSDAAGIIPNPFATDAGR